MNRWRSLVRRGIEGCDSLYRYRLGLTSVGPALYVGRVCHRGPVMRFADGTELQPGAAIGTLHFNNARLAQIAQPDRHRTGFEFARLMRASLTLLAERTRADEIFGDVQVYQGITWVRSHGERVGFQSTPLRQGWRKRLLSWHFRVIVWAFSPAAASTHWEPRFYWLTRDELLKNFGSNRARAHPRNVQFERDAQGVSVSDL
jgi:hypothetical protein